MTEDLAALQANALAAQDTIDGFLTAAIEAESTPGLLESHSALASELRSEVSRKTVAIESVLVRIDAALELLEDIASPKHGEALCTLSPTQLRAQPCPLHTKNASLHCSKSLTR